MSALTQRVFTAAILAPLAVAGILALPTSYFAMLMAAVILAGAWEWAGLVGWASVRGRLSYLAVFVLALLGGEWLARSATGLGIVLGAALVWWLVALGLVWHYQAQGGLGPGPKWLRGLVGWLVLVPPWVSLVSLHGRTGYGGVLVLTLLVLIWSADIAAFFAGRRWGRRRLASHVSPGKSWEGVVGGLLAVLAVAVVSGVLLELADGQLLLFLVLCLATALISILGDLTESVFKRQVGLKDSGRLLPGHGGVLDRIDSLTAAAPLFAAGMLGLFR